MYLRKLSYQSCWGQTTQVVILIKTIFESWFSVGEESGLEGEF